MKTVCITLNDGNITSSQDQIINSIVTIDSSFVDLAEHLGSFTKLVCEN